MKKPIAKIHDTTCLRALNESIELLDKAKENLSHPQNPARFAAAKLYNDNAGKRIKAASVAKAITDADAKIEDFFD